MKSRPVRSPIVRGMHLKNSHRAATVPGYDIALGSAVTRGSGWIDSLHASVSERMNRCQLIVWKMCFHLVRSHWSGPVRGGHPLGGPFSEIFAKQSFRVTSGS